ncbi:MAG: hypothetical protein A2731_03825 [Candidatus Buchananbacteria bacterium RIFCSPHIGHO2_01_FULL_39_8]|uniref:Glycosyltransferase RgtA/B/C/D-like domain-containing protein n=1 Tax=Candidatus Buchananbacteria bacterium RIFCSPHIGHO2_01_FULL_39_8 TaxID=1797533 RepID=A0A1G1XU69_9BACT|nr:MAG: hypothetical protein A2731_03825 [Candidatus Buchananbacteria bacterium RIFCSPHIGHO2_01_FULL_39_8]
MFKKPTFILIILLVIFLGVYFWLVTPINTGLDISHRFDWPDETANYFWIRNYADTNQLILPEPLNLVAANQIYPRSFNVMADGTLVPGSFLGLILLYGILAKVFGNGIIIYLTPLFAVFGVFAFYGIIKLIFGQRVAILSAILMLFNPVWWYYSATSMLPNVTFISCFLISIFFLLKVKKESLSLLILSAFFAGLTFSIRPSEIIWLLAVYLTVLLYHRDKFNFWRLVLFLLIVVLIIVPSFYNQKILYNSWLVSGYSQLDKLDEISCEVCQITKSVILPFGFHPMLAAYNFWVYYLSRFWWLALLSILGFVAFLAKKGRQEPEQFNYILLSIFIGGWLIIYYGSWQFSDLLTVHLNTLGLSYVRYWLPLYIIVLPFSAFGLIWLTNIFRRRLSGVVLFLLLVFLFYKSADLVLQAKPDSLLPVRERIATYKQNAAAVFEVTELDSVIITVRKDKLFFPERRVIHTFEALSLNNQIMALLPALLKVVPVYYYALGPEPSLDLSDGIHLELVKNVGQEILYKIEAK